LGAFRKGRPFDGVQSCDGFQNVFSGEISLRVTTYFDAAESPSRVQIHATGEEIDVNSITGKSISIRGNWLIKIDLVSGTFTLAGQFIMSNEPGQGNAIHSTGRLVFDADDNAVFSAGPHEVLETNGEIFCTALS